VKGKTKYQQSVLDACCRYYGRWAPSLLVKRLKTRRLVTLHSINTGQLQ